MNLTNKKDSPRPKPTVSDLTMTSNLKSRFQNTKLSQYPSITAFFSLTNLISIQISKSSTAA